MSQGERNAGGAQNLNILADTFEAILGALYIDQGFDAVFQSRERHYFLFWTSQNRIKGSEISPPRNHTTTHQCDTPVYGPLSEEWKDHAKVFTISASITGVTIGTGMGTNKKLAQEAAASDALQQKDKWEYLLQSQI
jgi:ribonuclease-3